MHIAGARGRIFVERKTILGWLIVFRIFVAAAHSFGQLEKMSQPMDEQTPQRLFGGCEGPDAMYVKLISSDGHEFIVKREHALTSGTIKAMLSGPGQFAENEANEVNFREIP